MHHRIIELRNEPHAQNRTSQAHSHTVMNTLEKFDGAWRLTLEKHGPERRGCDTNLTSRRQYHNILQFKKILHNLVNNITLYHNCPNVTHRHAPTGRSCVDMIIDE